MSGETSGGGTIVGNVVGASMCVNEGGATGGVNNDAGFQDAPMSVVVVVVCGASAALDVGNVAPKPKLLMDKRAIDRYFIYSLLLRPTVKIFHWANDAGGVFNCYFHGVVKFFWAYFFATFKVAKCIGGT